MTKLFITRHSKILLTYLLCVCFVVLPFLQPQRFAFAQQAAQEISCNVTSEAAFRSQLEAILRNILSQSIQTVNYDFIVKTSWQKNRLNEKIDLLVDREVTRLRNDNSILELVQTLTSQKAREQLAQDIATGVYGSERFKTSIAAITADVGQAISEKLDVLSVKSADPISLCVQRFVGPQYGETIATLISQQTRQEMSFNPDGSDATTSVTDIISESSAGLTGGLLIVLRQTIVNRLSQVLGRRLVGALATRAVGAAVSLIGWVLVAKELWDLRLGVLPIVAKEMKSEDAKTRIQTELITEMKLEVDKALKDVPVDIAQGVLNLWSEFKTQNAKTVALAKKYDVYRQFLEDVESSDETQQVARLRVISKLTSFLLDKSGEEGVLQAVEDGTLKRIITSLPESAVTIALDTGSLDDAFAWFALAGNDVGKVVRYNLHKTSLPKDFTDQSLKRLLSIDNQSTIQSVAQFEQKYRTALLDLPQDQFQDFTTRFSPEELSSLAIYIEALEPQYVQQLISRVQENPQKMTLLQNEQVRFGILNSFNQRKAIAYILRDSSSFELLNFYDDVQLMLSGDVNPLLLWKKQPFVIIALSFALLIFLLIIYRVLFGRRKKVAA